MTAVQPPTGEFSFDIEIGAKITTEVANSVTSSAISALEIYMKLMGEEGVIDDGAYVLMYASLMNKLEFSEFESAACFL